MVWIQKNFFIPETKGPIQLYDSQIVPLREALRRDDAGHFIYTTVVWSAIKKSAKTAIAAAVTMWFAWRVPGAKIIVMGNDQRQAQSRVYEAMVTAVKLRQDWRDSIKINLYDMTLPNGSKIEAIAVDPAGEAGGNYDFVVATELWGWKSQKHQQMWTETTVPPTKFGQALRWCESYAGYVGDSPVLEQLYKAGVEDGEVIDETRQMYRTGRTFLLWNTMPTLPWQTEEYYADQAAVLRPSEFARVHRNQWADSLSEFVPIQWWDACEGAVPALDPYQMCVVALDAAVSGDCFAIDVVSRVGEVVQVRETRVWTPPAGGKIDYSNPHDKDDPTTPEGYLRDLARRLPIVEFAYDPYQLHDLATRLMADGVGFFREFSQGSDRLEADKALYDRIRDRRIVHNGDPVLRRHVQNAGAKSENERLRIVKTAASGRPVDACVALSMAAYRAAYLNIG